MRWHYRGVSDWCLSVLRASRPVGEARRHADDAEDADGDPRAAATKARRGAGGLTDRPSDQRPLLLLTWLYSVNARADAGERCDPNGKRRRSGGHRLDPPSRPVARNAA